MEQHHRPLGRITAPPRGHHPEPPVNVQVKRKSGLSVPAECVYLGQSDDLDRWEVVTVVTGVDRDAFDGLHVDVMPADSSITVRFTSQGGSL